MRRKGPGKTQGKFPKSRDRNYPGQPSGREVRCRIFEEGRKKLGARQGEKSALLVLETRLASLPKSSQKHFPGPDLKDGTTQKLSARRKKELP